MDLSIFCYGSVSYNTVTAVFWQNEISFFQRSSNMTETLYKYKDVLETIFRAIDTDNSGWYRW